MRFQSRWKVKVPEDIILPGAHPEQNRIRSRVESDAGGTGLLGDKEGKEKCSCRAEISAVAPVHRLCSQSYPRPLWERWPREWQIGARGTSSMAVTWVCLCWMLL